MTLKLLLFIIAIAPLAECEKPVVFCDDVYGKYTSLSGTLTLSTSEFPIMSSTAIGVGTTVSDLTIPKLMHPCYSLSDSNNYKNQLFDIFSLGEFASSVCERQCAHFVDATRFECGDRRPPPSWIVGNANLGAKRKINCSDWAIPLTEKGKKDGISLIFTYATFQSGNGEDLPPPYTLDNKSIEYLSTMFLKGLHIKPIVDGTKKDEALAEMESMLDAFVSGHPEIVHVAFGNPITFFGDAFRNDEKYYAPRFIPTSKFWTTLAKLPSLNSLSLSLIQLTGQESIPAQMTRSLKAIGFYNVTMTSVPSWLNSGVVQFLEFKVSISDETDISILDQLPNLEHFLLSESSLTSIKSPFLAKSSKLISLTLQCNSIEQIAAGAFDHFTELRFLNLAGNRLVTLTDNLLINLNNLVALDLKALDNSTISIQTFNEIKMECQANLKGYPALLEAMPKVPKPENLMVLEIRGQENLLKNDQQLLKEFKNLEILNLGNLGLTSIRNMSLETLCSLRDLNLVGNPLSDNQWIGDDMFINLNLHSIRMGSPNSMVDIPNALVAFMRTSSQIMYSAPISLNYVDLYKKKVGCYYDVVSSATMFGYKLQNSSCERTVDDAIKKIRSLEFLRMDTQCQ